MHCYRCGRGIDPERAEFLAGNRRPATCVDCSQEQPAVCFTSYDHKTAGHLVVVGTDPEQIRMARRAYRRAR
jgi:hypothetical protein